MLMTFFRHYCLYEYAFKPKVDIVLMTLPPGGIPRQSTASMMGMESNQDVHNLNEAISNLEIEKSD